MDHDLEIVPPVTLHSVELQPHSTIPTLTLPLTLTLPSALLLEPQATLQNHSNTNPTLNSNLALRSIVRTLGYPSKPFQH